MWPLRKSRTVRRHLSNRQQKTWTSVEGFLPKTCVFRIKPQRRRNRLNRWQRKPIVSRTRAAPNPSAAHRLYARRFTVKDQSSESPPLAAVRRTSSATTGVAPHGRLVMKRSVPSLASNARPDCDDPPRYCPHDRGMVATHGEANCGGGAFTDACGAGETLITFAAVDDVVFPALSTSVAHNRITTTSAPAFQRRLFMSAPPQFGIVVLRHLRSKYPPAPNPACAGRKFRSPASPPPSPPR